MDFKNTDKSYGPIPLWLWNSKLNTSLTLNTAAAVNALGFGGFAVCPANGLLNAHLGDEWFRNISAAQHCAADNSMQMWILNKPPRFSGYSSSSLQENGLVYQQKTLCYEAGEKTNERTIIFSGGYHFYYDVNPFCIDVFSPEAKDRFIEETYLKYADKDFSLPYGIILNSSPFKYNCIPWSFTLPAKYKNEYGEELLDVLVELFKPVGNYKATRYKFWSLLIKLYNEEFLVPVHNWCKENKIKFSALSINNSGLETLSYAGAMLKFCSSDLPGVEAKSQEDISAAKALMAASVVHQFDKEGALAILYENCGHSRTFEDFKMIAEQYLVRGITKIFPASLPYSLNGFRKTTTSSVVMLDGMHKEDNLKFNSYFTRLTKLLAEGSANFDTLLIHNQTDALRDFEVTSQNDSFPAHSELNYAIEQLEKKHIPFDIGDEFLLQKYAYVDKNYLVIGKQKYSTIVLTRDAQILDSTTKLLAEFEAGGGFIAMTDALCDSPVCDNPNLCYTVREFSEFKMHYFVNSSQETFTAAIPCGSKLLDCYTGELIPFFGIHKFSAYESIVVIDDGTPQLPRPYVKPLKTLDISGMWDIERASQNALLLDKCDVYINKELICEKENIYDVNEILSKLQVASDFECVFKFNIEELSSDVFMNVEISDSFCVKINGNTVSESENIMLEDTNFPKTRITEYLVLGENTICLSGKISMSDKSKSLYDKASVYETELGLFSYDKEICPVILLGDFSVISNGVFRRLDKKALRYIGDFAIGKKADECDISNIEKSGFPFFGGRITLKKTFNLSDTSYCIKFSPKAIRSASVEVNSKKVSTLLSSPFEYDLSEYLVKGDNEIRITFTSSLRNMLGPHHVPLGELYDVTPYNYHRLPCVWSKKTDLPWENNYCFLEFGIDLME